MPDQVQQSVAGFQVERMPEGSDVIPDLNESRPCSSSGWQIAAAPVKTEKIRMKERAAVAIVEGLFGD